MRKPWREMAVALGYLQAVLNKLETTDEGGFSRCDSLKLWQGIWVSKVFKDNGGVLLEMGPRSRENDYIIQSMSCQQGIFFFFFKLSRQVQLIGALLGPYYKLRHLVPDSVVSWPPSVGLTQRWEEGATQKHILVSWGADPEGTWISTKRLLCNFLI